MANTAANLGRGDREVAHKEKALAMCSACLKPYLNVWREVFGPRLPLKSRQRDRSIVS